VNRIMWDGINSDAKHIKSVIEPGDLVAYYIDGHFAWSPSQIAMFPDNQHITITVLGNAADVADCETGDLTPASAAGWARRRRAQGYWRPTIYCSTSVIPEVRSTTGNLILGRDYDIWDAHYDNREVSDYAGVAAKQYKSESMDDISVVFDGAWPHRVATVQPTSVGPSVTAAKWPIGRTLKKGDLGNAVLALQQACHNSGMRGVRGIAVDGDFGQVTEVAVSNFQEACGLSVDGIAGAQTRGRFLSRGLINRAGQANP
jgi:peptidoglycan hydrolase-like protein with peptidoglycan-binding domain